MHKIYGTNNGEDMPASFLTSHQTWDQYISSIWAGVLQALPPTPHQTIVEIGPGVSTKIGGALKECDFQGTLYVMDALESVIRDLKPLYENLLPHADIIWVHAPLSEGLKTLPKDIDIVLGNHILDDMIIFDAAGSNAIAWSSSYKHTPDDVLKNVWADVQKDESILSASKNNVRDVFLSFIDRTNIKALILNQYPSATLQDHDMDSLNKHALDVLQSMATTLNGKAMNTADIQQILNKNNHYNNAHIGQNVLNAKNWMICNNV